MYSSQITHNHVRHLNIEAVTAWKSQRGDPGFQEAYDLLVEQLVIAEHIIELPTNPAYWSMQDVHAMQVYITRLQARAEAYHLEMQLNKVPAPDDNSPL